MDDLEEPEPDKCKISVNEKFVLASGLYKTSRISDVENALKFGEALRRGAGDFYLFRILCQLIGEDGSPAAYNQLAPTIRVMFNAAKTSELRGHDAWLCIYLVAKMEKWYECPEGIELEKIRHQINKNNPEIKVPHPSWLYDYHTHEGRRRIAAGTANLSLDGRWEHRFNILKRYEDLKKANSNLSPEQMRKRWLESHYQNNDGGAKYGEEGNKGATEAGTEGTKQPDKSQTSRNPEDKSQEAGNQAN